MTMVPQATVMTSHSSTMHSQVAKMQASDLLLVQLVLLPTITGNHKNAQPVAQTREHWCPVFAGDNQRTPLTMTNW